VSVITTDNDTAGITASLISGNTTEAAGTATFTVVLDSQPSANVTIGVSSSDATEGTVSSASLTFTSVNWNTPQTVTVTGVNDAIVDGDITYSIVLAAATSADANYNGVNPSDVSVINTDNDAVGITPSLISGNTTEAAGTATFTVVLDSQPSANVTIGVSSSDATEGTVSTATLTFTTANWNTPQTVTVTGVNDAIDDGNITYNIVLAAATSADGNYNGVNPSDVSVITTDDDAVGITASLISANTTEAGGTATFTVVLDSQPSANVSVGVSSSDATEGSVSPASLTFTTANWNTLQTVTVTGIDDNLDDGNITYNIVLAAATSADGTYNGVNPSDVSVINTDNDTAGITASLISGNTTEAAGTATFTVVLDSQPTANVTIGVSSSDATEGSVSPGSLTFTTANWNTPQTVTVTGLDDLIDDGNITYNIVLAAATSADGTYNGVNPSDVSVINTDDDTAGITASLISGNTTEAAGTATFTVVLDSQPSANVTIGVSSSDATEGAVSPSTLTFTTANWNTPQTVTVTGANDVIVDGNITYSIVLAAATSADGAYNGVNPSDVTLSNSDDDTAHITTSLISANTTEAGGTATFTVVLSSQPSANVTVGASSSDATEGSVSAASLTFTSVNWNTPQTITVTGVNDAIVDGDITYSIVLAAAVSADGNYNGVNPSDVSVTNTDNDAVGITASLISGNTTEAGGTATFTVVLDSQPSANVAIGVSSSNAAEGAVSTASLTFTTANWNTPQTVTVTGANDAIDDGNITYTIVLAAATSADGTYNGVNPSDVSVINTDNDTAGITASLISTDTTEAAGTATFTVVLDSQPSANVTIGVSSSDATEGSVSPASLTFTTANWSTPQTVTVTGADDAIVDGAITYNIVLAAAVSADGNYNGVNPSDVSVINTDNDTALAGGEWVTIPANSGGRSLVEFKVMKYEARAQTGGATDADGLAALTFLPTSEPTNTPWRSITASQAKGRCRALGTGYDLISNEEWMVIARMIESQDANWSGTMVGSGCLKKGNTNANTACGYQGGDVDRAWMDYGPLAGRDNKAKFLLYNDGVNVEIIDFGGNASEWVEWNPSVGNEIATDDVYTGLPYSCSINGELNSVNCGTAPGFDYRPNGPYTSAQGIGEFVRGLSAGQALLRGGERPNVASGMGVYTMDIGYTSSEAATWRGFRCVKR
jgi:hypothetical protein